MRSVAIARSGARLRARRWDVVILGSALPGLLAAIRLAMGRRRVLVIEEEEAARRPVALREPFFLPGSAAGGVLDACLRELALPLIDRRRLAPDPVAYQVVLPGARVDVGGPALTAEELVAWGFAKPDVAHGLTRDLAEAAAAEREALLESPLVHSGRLRGLARAMAPSRAPRHARGLPEALLEPDEALAPLLAAQVNALANVAGPVELPEARARLLGAALEGGASFATVEDSLLGLLRRRFQALHGEIRLLSGACEMIAVDGQPGIAPAGSGEVWLGRALVLNAPLAPLTSWLAESGGGRPDFLPPPPALRRRATIGMKAPREVVPEGMARRVLRVGDPTQPIDGANLMRIGLFPEKTGGQIQIVASLLAPAGREPNEADEERLIEAVVELMPFADDRLRRATGLPQPLWDDDLAVEQPRRRAGWPAEIDLRLLTRPPVYRLPREEIGVLGLEGDCLLGWRAGDAIGADLG